LGKSEELKPLRFTKVLEKQNLLYWRDGFTKYETFAAIYENRTGYGILFIHRLWRSQIGK
jgi:hypothetical protein